MNEGRVTYHEVRQWARWLGVFTASDLTDSIGCDPSLGPRFITALEWNGIIEDTGDTYLNGRGPERIYAYIPLPPGPKEHPHGEPPELIAVREMGGFEILSQRGLPVRIRTDRDTRQLMSTPGARHRIRQAEERWRKLQEAIARRKEAQKAKAQKEPKWKRRKK